MKKARPQEEKSKPFKLVKYFTFSSLTLIFIVTVLLSILNAQWVRSMQFQKSKDYALVLIENLNHQIFIQFLIPVALKYGKIQLREPEQFERMDRVVRNTLHSFRVQMVNIYDMNNTISYSFDREMVGLRDLGGLAYKEALAGKTTHLLEQRGYFLKRLFGNTQESRIITYAPLRAERTVSRISGPVLGVVEIVQDLSEDYKTIHRFQVRVILTITAVMIALFLVLFYVVKRGEGIIEQRAAERLKLKEQLSRARHLSTLGEMVAAVSHEIRNPLGIIRSSAELLKKRAEAAGTDDGIIDVIIEESGRLNNIITDFLNFARPKEPDRQPCMVEDILLKNIGFFSSEIDPAVHRIETDFQHGRVAVEADADMLYQAFLNILINARQAMPEGGVIRIRTCVEDGRVVVVFDDHGGGVPEGMEEKIWDPFFTTKDKGTGLGLGIVKNIIEAHDGSIHIENNADGGARVVISLPIFQEE